MATSPHLVWVRSALADAAGTGIAFRYDMRPLKLRTVVVATDLDRSSDPALDSGHRLAEAAGAALHVVHVLTPAASGDPRMVRGALRRAQVPADDAQIHLIPGSAPDTIRALADRMSADVVVVGAHRERDHAEGSHPLGGTARAIVEGSFAPCLVAARSLRLPLERVIVPIDLSDTARGALLVSLSWASALRTRGEDEGETTLTVLHVDTLEDDDSRAHVATSVDEQLQSLHREAGAWAGVDVRADTRASEDAAEAITDYALERRADLVVLGTRGLGLDDIARLGSVSASVTTRSSVPTLLVPPAVWRVHGAAPPTR